MSTTIPQDIRYTDLTTAQVAFLQDTVPIDATRNQATANINVTAQANGLMTVTIHFTPAASGDVGVQRASTASPSPLTVRAPGIVSGSPPAQAPAAPAEAAIPTGSATVQSGMVWFKQTFATDLHEQLAASPYGIDLLTAMAVQETFEVWGNLFKNLQSSDVLQLCVGDTLDAPRRSAFPTNKADLLAIPSGPQIFRIARQALEAVGNVNAAYHKVAAANPDKFCHGFGIFQYDLQFSRDNPSYFLSQDWFDFGKCLQMAVKELDAAKTRAYGSGKTQLSRDEMVYVAIAYNQGQVDINGGFKQGYEDPSGKYYGELIAEYLDLSSQLQ